MSESTSKIEEDMINAKQMVLDKINEIRGRIDDKYNEFQQRLDYIKDAIEKRKQARQKRIQKSTNIDNVDTGNMSDIIDDLKIN